MYETSGHLALSSNEITYELLALQLDPNREDGEGRWKMDGEVEEKGGLCLISDLISDVVSSTSYLVSGTADCPKKC